MLNNTYTNNKCIPREKSHIHKNMQSKYLKARIKDTVLYKPHEIKLIKNKISINHTYSTSSL